jgi:putative membrane protein
MWWYGDHTSGWGWVLMTLGMVAFWGLLIAGILVHPRAVTLHTQHGSATMPPTPEQLFAERFARGEIDETEYTGRLAALHAPVRS